MSAHRFLAAMVDQLVASGRLRTSQWISVFRQVPRHAFLPRFFRQSSDLSGWEAIGVSDPGALELIYTDTTWVTQLDGDDAKWEAARRAGGPIQGTPTSSSSAPGLMALMLEALDVNDGDRVLEVGTGTGYQAALLCRRLSSAQVTTVEVDPVVADAASLALHACGCSPRVVVGDGVAGHPEGAPYDRLIATCSTPDVPASWIAQTRAGGVILTSLFRGLGGGPLVRLRVDGDRAEGRFLPEYGSFMPVRTVPPLDPAARLEDVLRSGAGGTRRTTGLGAEVLDSIDFGMIAALRMTGVVAIDFVPESGPQRWLFAEDGSWACVDEAQGVVAEQGSRRLWQEVEDLYTQWQGRGAPTRERIGVTVTDSGEHRFWADDSRAVWWTQREEPALRH